MQMTPVKACAVEHNIEVFQPVKIKTPEAVEVLKGYGADLFVVAAFGQILSKEILDMPKYGCVNIHASLLPKYRGAAPMQRAIIDGKEFSSGNILFSLVRDDSCAVFRTHPRISPVEIFDFQRIENEFPQKVPERSAGGLFQQSCQEDPIGVGVIFMEPAKSPAKGGFFQGGAAFFIIITFPD